MLEYTVKTDDWGEYLEATCSRGRLFKIDVDAMPLLEERWFVLRSRPNARTKYVARSRRGGGLVLLHREIMRAPAGLEVDHIYGDGLNDRRYNMRLATHAQNKGNSHYPKRSATGVSGRLPSRQ